MNEQAKDYLLNQENFSLVERLKAEEDLNFKPKLFIVQFHIQICTMNHKI